MAENQNDLLKELVSETKIIRQEAVEGNEQKQSPSVVEKVSKMVGGFADAKNLIPSKGAIGGIASDIANSASVSGPQGNLGAIQAGMNALRDIPVVGKVAPAVVNTFVPGLSQGMRKHEEVHQKSVDSVSSLAQQLSIYKMNFSDAEKSQLYFQHRTINERMYKAATSTERLFARDNWWNKLTGTSAQGQMDKALNWQSFFEDDPSFDDMQERLVATMRKNAKNGKMQRAINDNRKMGD